MRHLRYEDYRAGSLRNENQLNQICLNLFLLKEGSEATCWTDEFADAAEVAAAAEAAAAALNVRQIPQAFRVLSRRTL